MAGNPYAAPPSQFHGLNNAVDDIGRLFLMMPKIQASRAQRDQAIAETGILNTQGEALRQVGDVYRAALANPEMIQQKMPEIAANLAQMTKGAGVEQLGTLMRAFMSNTPGATDDQKLNAALGAGQKVTEDNAFSPEGQNAIASRNASLDIQKAWGKPMSVGAGSRVVDPRSGGIVATGLPTESTAKGAIISGLPKDQQTGIVAGGQKPVSTSGATPLRAKPPVGYAYNDDGTLAPIPGGPAAQKTNEKKATDTYRLQTLEDDMDSMKAAADELKAHSGTKWITGITGRLNPELAGSDSANARAALNSLKSKIRFGVLEKLKASSKTGGAVGSVSNEEGKAMEANLASLETAQDYEQMASALDKISQYADGAKSRMRNAYDINWGGGSSGGAKAGPSEADVRAARAAIAKGAPSDAVNARFKQKFGVDLPGGQ